MKPYSKIVSLVLLSLCFFVTVSANITARAAGCTAPPAGLVGWWKGDGNAVDVVAGNNGVNQNVTYPNGVVGQAFAFDPENNPGAYIGIQIADQPAYALTNSLTIEGWIRPRGNGYNIFWRGDNRYGLDPYSLGMSANSNINFLITDSGGNSATIGTTIPYFVWTHVAATLDGSSGTMSIYTNGVLAGQTTTSVRPFGPLIAGDSPGIGIGNVNDGFNNFPFTGDIDEISLYNRALSAAEIQAIYNAGSAGKCEPTTTSCVTPPAGLVSWWPGQMNANDSVGTNNGIANNIGYASGEVGSAFYMNGSNAFIAIPASSSLNVGIGGGFTFEAWINPASVLNQQALAEWNGNSNDGGIGTHLWISTSQSPTTGYPVGCLYANIRDTNNGDHILTTGAGVVTSNSFQHVALTYDKTSGIAVVYVNGAPAQTENLGSFTPQTSYGLYLGTRPSGFGTGSYFGGAMDETSIYNRALSSNEIAAIYNAGSAGKCTTTSTGAPVISNISPASSRIGTVATISGNNFSATPAANIVYFGAEAANVLSASPTNLLVSVPVGATFTLVTVTVNGLTAYADQPFMPTFAGIGQFDTTSLAPFVNLPTLNGPGQVVIADLDGDGKPDLIIPDSYAGEISIYQNISTNGTLTAGSFGPRVDLPVLPSSGTSPYFVVVADLDGDGRLDLVVLNPDNNVVSILRNISSPGPITTNSFAARIDLPGGSSMRGLAVRDLNGDGLPDIVTANSGENTVSVYQNLSTVGNIAFAPRVNFTTDNGPQGLAVADLDGDGNPDIVSVNWNFPNWNNSTLSIFRNLGTGGNITTNSFAPEVSIPTVSTAFPIAIGDLDGDGKPDLVVGGSENSSTIAVYRNTSTPGSITASSFAAPVIFSAPGWVNSIALADLDGDGKLDIAMVSQISSVFSVFKNVSQPGSFTTASLAPRVDYAAGYNPNGMAVGDLDGDGRPDIIFANTYDNTISIYQNLVPFGMTPVIATQPTNTVAAVGSTASFSVTANGTAPLTYQWSFNGTNLVGATNATLTLPNVQQAQAGNYVVLVTNFLGVATSSNATLSVFVPASPPTIFSQTPNQVVLLGNTATFSVNAGGSVPLSYFWQRNGALISGATNASYSLYNAQLSDSGSKFSCLVTNVYGSASSTNVSLKVINSTVANDLCSGAIVITNASYTNVQSTVQATSFGDPVPDCVDGFGHGVWYQFTSPIAGLLIVDTFGSDFDTGLAIYTGTCDTLTEVACNDDTGGVTSQVITPTAAGATYSILAGGYESDAGNLVLHLNYFTPPAFAVQPTNTSVVVSSNASFAATLAGSLPMSFQWYFNNTPLTDGGRISGSASPTLNIANVLTNDGGNYQLVVSNMVGVVTSSVAVLTPIILPPVITVPPTNESILIGSNAMFTAVVSGTPPYNYQWSFNGTPLVDDGVHIIGSATNTLNIVTLTAADAGTYTLAVTNVSGATNSSAMLTVLIPPAITSPPVGRSVPPGLPTIFTAAASGVPAPSYQWQLNGTNLPNATSSSYTNLAIGTNDLGFYQIIASNSVGITISAPAQLTFGPVAAWGLNTSGECLPPPGLSNVVAIAGNRGASFGVRTDGTIIPWGSGTVTNIPASASNVVALATSDGSPNFALRSDGSVIGWPNYTAPVLSNIVSIASGYGFAYGLRAEGTVTNILVGKNVPLPAGLTHITAIACGYSSALALRSDGTVVIAGTDGITNPPAGLNNVTAVAAGFTYAMALKSNGTVVAWGSGTGTNLPPGLTNIIAISAGNYVQENSGAAIRADGAIFEWGDNNSGDKTPPAGMSNLVSIAVSTPALHSLALVNNGGPVILQPPVGLTAYTGRDVTLQAAAVGAAPLNYQWLFNGTNLIGATNTTLFLPGIQSASAGSYQLSVSNVIGTALSLPAPVNVISNGTLTLLSTPVGRTNYQGSKVTLGTVVLGNGLVGYQWYYSTNSVINFTAVSGATNDSLVFDPALARQSGYYRVVASNQFSSVTSLATYERVLFAKAFGYNSTDPTGVVTNATAIAVGQSSQNSFGNYFALRTDGQISSWSGSFSPYGETNFSSLSNVIVTAVAAGYSDSLALRADGTVYAAGFGIYGQTNVPSGLSGVVGIACGDYHDLALKYDGTVTGWGQNTYGQATNVSYIPGYGYIPVTNVVTVAAGGNNSIGLHADGSVVTWGQYGNGQYLMPYNATNIIAVAAGSTHFLALRANGTVVGWGSSPYGQATIPASWTNIVAISAGGNHSTALRNDGTVLTLGNYLNGPALTTGNVPSDLANVVAIASSGDHDLALFGTRAPVFTVQPWNRAIPSTASTNITLAAKCAGVQPVSYQWQLNGTNVPGATNDTLILTNQPFYYAPIRLLPTGDYQLIASNAYGVAASKYIKVTSFIPLGVALNATNLNWTTSGNALWLGETNITHDGVSAAQSGGIGALQQTILQTTVATNWPGSYTFWWNVSSEQDFDILEFRINGIVQASISGSPGWQQVSIPVAAGTNTLMWRYYKDPTIDVGLDAGWVDQFAYIPAPPQITVQPQPASQTVNMGATVTYSVAAISQPGTIMFFKWYQNGNLINNNYGPVLTLNNVGRAQNGIYSVTVTTNFYGSGTISSNVVLTVLVPQLLGAPVVLPNGSFQVTSTDANGGLLSPSNLPNFEAQASTNLMNWMTLPNALSLTNGMLLLQDGGSTNYAARYYRIIEH
jgi:alpha-tubulin suppressor-like RCC1 family protein